MIYTLFEENDTEDSRNSLSDVSPLDDDFAAMQFEPLNILFMRQTIYKIVSKDGI
jgi:hypothetical protein